MVVGLIQRLAKEGSAETSEGESAFWRHVEETCSSIPDALAWLGSKEEGQTGGVGAVDKKERARIEWRHFRRAVGETLGIREDGAARALFDTIAQQSHDDFCEGDLIRAHSRFHRRLVKPTESKIDHGVGMREPDGLAKATDMRMEHQFLRAPVSEGKGFNRVWQYPAPSLELEARRVIDLWRGVAGKPWQSLQEAKQHFRKAFAFLDTDADGRVTMHQFRAGLARLRYKLSDAAAGKLFDHMQTCGGKAAEGHVTFSDFASPLLTGSRSREGPRVWLRHSRIVSFDTSRLPLRQLVSVRQLHERGDSIHDGVQGRKHRPNCTQPCCVPELNAEGFWGEPVHRAWSALGETTAGEDNMFVSPPFRHNDIPVPKLYECLTPAPLPTGAPYAMLGPVNNYASRDREPWQAPSVLVSAKDMCWRCNGTGGAYNGKGYKRGLEEARKTGGGALEYVHAASERSQVCQECHGTGWSSSNSHVCEGHRDCRNLHLKNGAGEENPAYLPVPRIERKAGAEAGTARLHVIIVQARNLPARDLWKGDGAGGVTSAHTVVGRDRGGRVWGDRWETPNTHCEVGMGRRGANRVERTVQVRGSTYPVYNEEFSFPIEHGGQFGRGLDVLLEASGKGEVELGTLSLDVVHKGKGGEREILGSTRVTVRQMAATGGEERWFNLEHSNGQPVIGTDSTGGSGWHSRGAHKQQLDWSDPSGSHPDATGFHPGLAAIHLRFEIRVDGKPHREPHGQASRSRRRVVVVDKGQQTEGAAGGGREIKAGRRGEGAVEAEVQTDEGDEFQDVVIGTSVMACQTEGEGGGGRVMAVRASERVGGGGKDSGVQAVGGPSSGFADVQTTGGGGALTEGGQQTEDEAWRSQNFFRQVIELDRFSGGGEGGDGVPLGSLTQEGVGPFSLRAVVLQVMAIWDHVHVPERRLAVPMGGDMRGWRSKEVGRFVVPQHGDARTIRLEFNLDGKNLSGGFPGLSGSVTSPGTRDKFRRLVTRGLAKALGVSEDRIQCGLPQPSSPLLCDVDILGPDDVPGPAENAGPQNLVKRLRKMIDDRNSAMVKDGNNIASKLRRAGAFPWREGHARYCQELFLHARAPGRAHRHKDELGGGEEEEEEEEEEGNVRRDGRLKKRIIHAAFGGTFGALLGHVDRLLLLMGRLITDPPRKLELVAQPPTQLAPLPRYRPPALRAPPPPPGLAPAQIPQRVPPELIPLPHFADTVVDAPVFTPPPADEPPPFRPPPPLIPPDYTDPEPRPPPKKPRLLPYPWMPLGDFAWPTFERPSLLREPEFTHPPLKDIPTLQPPDLHTIPAPPARPPWPDLMLRLLGPRPVIIMDVSGSMCTKGGNCRHAPGTAACSFLDRMREGVGVLLRPGGELVCKEWYDVIGFNHGAARWKGGEGGGVGCRDFIDGCTTERWMGRWVPCCLEPQRAGGEWADCPNGAFPIPAGPGKGWRRGNSELLPALAQALSLDKASDIWVFSDGLSHLPNQVMDSLRRWRHVNKKGPSVNAVCFGDDPKGVRFMQDMASAGRGRYLNYTEGCRLPGRVHKAEGLAKVTECRREALKRENEQVWVHRMAEHTRIVNEIKRENEEALREAKEKWQVMKEKVAVMNQSRIKAADEAYKASLDEAKRKEEARLKALEEEWRSKCKEIDKHNAEEKQRYYDGIKARQMMQLANLQTAREKHRQLCEEIDEKSRTMIEEAKQKHAEDVKKVQMNNAHRLRLAEEEFEKRLSSVRAHNKHVADLSKTFTRRCAEIAEENQFRIQRGEEEFEIAWKAFVKKVGGEEAATELLEGKAEWRESAWAWQEYVSMINTATIKDEHLSKLRVRIVEEGEKLRLLSDVLEKDPASVGAEPWPRNRPNIKERRLGMRRELLRALGEWVHACEEVRANNMRLEGRARAEHNKRLVAVRRANVAKIKKEEKMWGGHKERVVAYNRDVEKVIGLVDKATEERHRLLAAHALLLDWLGKEEERRMSRKGGSGRGSDVPLWKVPRECMEKLWEIANSVPPGDWDGGDEDQVMKQAKTNEKRNIEHVGGGGDAVHSGTAPPMFQSWTRNDSSLQPLDVSLCHPVPSGVSSSALGGGSGAAARGRSEGYDPWNDRPLMDETSRSLGDTRPANRSSINAEEYRQEWDPRNWDFTSATRPINARERRRREEAAKANKESGGAKKERWTR